MANDKLAMDVDYQCEDGEISNSPDNSLEEEDADTIDSLEIKPPQALLVPHHKTTLYRRDRQTDRGGGSGSDRSRGDKERKSRYYEQREESRYKNKHSRHRRHEMEVVEKSRKSDPTKRVRESSRHERKERSTGDPVLGDLRERLLDKRREMREEPQREYKMKTSSSSRSREEGRISNGRGGERHDIRAEKLREDQEMRIYAAAVEAAAAESAAEATNRDQHREMRFEKIQERISRHIRMIKQDIANVELVEQQMVQENGQRSSSSKEKRHKRSHKHERIRENEREKMEMEITHREKQAREQPQAMDVSAYEELERMEAIAADRRITSNTNPREMTEQELRRQKLLEAEHEMARRKENSSIELDTRRMKLGEKRHHSPEIMPSEHGNIGLSGESVQGANIPSDNASEPNSNRSRWSDDDMKDATDEKSTDSEKTSSYDSGTDDDNDNDNDSNNLHDKKIDYDKKLNDDLNNFEYNTRSPLSDDQLDKSDSSEGLDSPRHVDTNGSNETKKDVIDSYLDLPPYYPAIEGCRSVEEYKCLNRIEEGTYGVVYRAEDRRTKEMVALKRVKMDKEKEGFPITSLREINTLLKAQHPNIVTVREIVVGSNMDKIFIVMDYVEHDLNSLMETMKSKNQVFVPGEIKCLMQQFLRAIAHLHDNWILHRDLKPSNLLLSHRGILKVGDFGLAREYGSPLKPYTPVVVTLLYRALELILGAKQYSTAIDMWSVGCIFAELIMMERLFPAKSEVDYIKKVFKELGTPNDRIWPGYSELPLVKKMTFPQYPLNNIKQKFSLTLSALGIDLLSKFLIYDPAKRITADEALIHGYFTESPLPIDPAMFPTWPAKSELGAHAVNALPKAQNVPKDEENRKENDALGFHMGSKETIRRGGGGFYLKF